MIVGTKPPGLPVLTIGQTKIVTFFELVLTRPTHFCDSHRLLWFSAKESIHMKFMLFVCLVLTFATSGCSTMKQSDTSRTGLEQLLISTAVDQSLNKVNFAEISGARVHFKSDLLDCVDKNYVILATKKKLQEVNCVLVDSADDADVTLEIASGGVGTDRTEMVVGTPEIPLGMMGNIPKINLYERNKAMGTAKLLVVATDVKTKQPVLTNQYSLARSDHQHWTMFGAGPILSGSVAEQIRVNTDHVDGVMVPQIRTASR